MTRMGCAGIVLWSVLFAGCKSDDEAHLQGPNNALAAGGFADCG